MNYAELKNLSWWQLMELLERTAKAHRNDTDLLKSEPNLQRAQVAPPTLCLLGDFEIRARFYETGRGALLYYGDTPLTSEIKSFEILDHIITIDEHYSLRAKYHELLYAVARAFPGESRHQTALRYIREAEERATQGPDCEAKPQPPAAA